MRRVAITGLGLVSSLGHDVESFWNATRNGETGVAPTTIPEADTLTARMVAEVKGWDGAKALDRKLLGLSDRFSQFAVYAAKQAVEDAGDVARDNAAIIIGTGVGGAVTLDESYFHLIDAYLANSRYLYRYKSEIYLDARTYWPACRTTKHLKSNFKLKECSIVYE